MKPLKRCLTPSSLPFLLLFALPPASQASDAWPGWAGPHQNSGNDTPLGLAGAPSVDMELVWKRPFGSGYSAVAVADGIGVSAASQGDGDYLEAFDAATGETRWRIRMAPVFLGRSGSDDGPGSTPVIADGTVFMVHPGGVVLAVDLESGVERWRRDLVATLDADPPSYGFTVSPIVADDVVVVPVGQQGKAMLAGLETSTGEPRWTAGTDGVGYQNPKLAHLAGRRQVVFAGNESLWGIDPKDGAVWWRHELGFRHESGLVILVDEDHVLYTGYRDETFLVAVEATPDGFTARRVWNQPVLKNNHCPPLFFRGHLYGFDGRFLSAVRASDGELVWKSRPPGGQTLSRVDDHLFMWDRRGALAAVEATPDGYREKGRLALSPQARIYTPPSYGAGLLFLRDLHELYAVRIGAGAAMGREGEIAAEASRGGDAADPVAAFLRALESVPAADRADRVDRFLAEHPRLPIVTADGRAHFLYRGDVPDLAIRGDMTGFWEEEPMRRIGGTELFHRAYDLPSTERWEYRFKIFERTELDPANPEQIDGPSGTLSVVTGAAWREAEVFARPSPTRRGRVEAVQVEDPTADRTYDFRVYTPPGYEPESDRRYPVVFFAHGANALEHGRATDLLDHLSGEAFAPVIAVFLELPQGVWWESGRERFFELLRELVLPRVDRDWRVRTDPAGRAMIAREWASQTSLLLVTGEPRLFGNLALQSPVFGGTFLDRELPSGLDERPALNLYVDWGRFDGRNTGWPADIRRLAPAFAERMTEVGWTVTTAERPGGHNWNSWRRGLAPILGAFFPPDG